MCHKECIPDLHSNDIKRSASDSNLNDANTLDSHSKIESCMQECSNEGIEPLFHSTNEVPTYTPVDIQTTPCSVDTFSDGSNSPAIPDSLNSSVVESDTDFKNSPSKTFLRSTPNVPIPGFGSERKQCFEKKTEEQPYYVCVDDSDTSTIDSHEQDLRLSASKYGLQNSYTGKACVRMTEKP